MSTGPGLVGPEDHILRRSQPARPVEGSRPIGAEKVVLVALNPDDDLRNLQVALLYSLTSSRLDEKLGPPPPQARPGPANANWFTIAQWAVLTVGRNLRTRDLPHRAALLPQAVRRRLTPGILSLRASDDRRVAAALSFGQVMVFASVYHALLKTAFADGVPRPDVERPSDVVPPPPERPEPSKPSEQPGQAAVLDLGGLAEMVDTYVAEREEAKWAERVADRTQRETVLQLARELGADVDDLGGGGREQFYEQVLERLAARAGHTAELQRAFSLYEDASPWGQAAATAAGRPVRPPADLIFEANLRIAAIEQVILDDAVTMVVDHVPNHAAAQLEGRLATMAERTLRVPRRIAQISTSRRLSLGAAVGRELWARVMTDQIMVVALPAETIRLGRDLPRRDWRRPFYAEGLERLSPEAATLFDQYDRSLGDGRGAGAGDWRRFDDRMNFVANLLRSRQQDPTLFWQPFTDEDVARVWSGAYPSRIADPFEQAVRAPSFPRELDTQMAGDRTGGLAPDGGPTP